MRGCSRLLFVMIAIGFPNPAIPEQLAIFVNDFGADPTGVVDSAAAWNAAIHQAATNIKNGTGPAIVYGCGQYKITAQIINTTSGVTLEGCGSDTSHNVPAQQSGTRLFWAGKRNGTMVLFGYASVGPGTTKNNGGGIRNLKIDAMSIAGNSLEIDSWNGGQWENITLYNPSASGFGLLLRTLTFGATSDDAALQMNHFRNIAIRSNDTPSSVARGIVLTDDETGHLSNPSFNSFDDVDIVTTNGVGIDCAACDNNVFNNARIYTTTAGGAPGVRLRASSAPTLTSGGANANVFNHLSPGVNGVLSEGTEAGTYPAVQNIITGYDKTNGSPDPVIGTGSTLSYGTTDPTWQPWVPTLGACTPGGRPPTFSVQSARFKRSSGNTVNFTVSFRELAKGTASGCITMTLPAMPVAEATVAGHSTVTGEMLQGWITSENRRLQIHRFDGSDPNGDRTSFVMSGAFEAQ